MVFDCETYNYSIISDAGNQKRRKGNQGKRRNNVKYKDLMCAFDIETTNIHEIEQAIMYIWQFQIEDDTIIGRSWDEFLLFIDRLCMQLKSDERLLVYVHNLSFEFVFLAGIYDFKKEDVFAIRRRKVLKALMFESIEFRCSYLLTNMSLKEFTKRMGVKEKLSGEEFNYNKYRFPWTALTDKELEYCITDVESLVKAMKVFYSIEHDNHYTIPVTSTGFVRRDIKKAMRHYNRKKFEIQTPSYNLYRLLSECFRGGNTHANRYYANMINSDLISYDRVSSYPDVQVNGLFPMGEWSHEQDADLKRVGRVMIKQKRACLLVVRFTNIRLKNPIFGCPYIPKDKCRNLRKKNWNEKDPLPHEFYNDNGRILYAESLEMVLTDIDLKIINNQYEFEEATIIDFYHCKYGKLPKPLIDVVLKYFKSKTELKNVKGEELYYFKAKEKLNSIYGCCAMRWDNPNIDFIDGEFIETGNSKELFEEYSKKAFLMYQWGVWTTALARYELEKMIQKVGDEFVYCDTDSVKFFNTGLDINDYNSIRKKQSEMNGGVAYDQTGKKHYLGVWELDGSYDQFVTLGAKKYAYNQDGKIGITVSGVGKSKGAEELKNKGGLSSFKEGFVFNDGGGTCAKYNDQPEITEYQIEGHMLKITSNCYICENTYTLGITGEYKRILTNPQIWLDHGFPLW